MSGPRVGLVLGAGGIMGGAWLTGGLLALAEETGWDPGSADRMVGTSAGSMLGTLLAGGVPPWFMVAHSAGRDFEGVNGRDGRPAASANRAGGGEFRLDRSLPRIGPGSWRLVARSLMAPDQHTASTRTIGWLPRGIISTEPLKDIVRRVTPSGWAQHPSFWVVACDYATGERVVFGSPGAPEADLADAVAASCAIPAFYRPVRINGRQYVDGGVRSTSNLDVLSGLGLDLVISMNPTSSLHPVRAWNPIERIADLNRSNQGRRLGREAKILRSEGTDVVLIQPLAEDLEAMGPNLMARRGRNRVIATARRTVARQLRSDGVRGLLRDLPAGTPYMVREPEGATAEWDRLREEALAARFS
jgi:NTE family protein